MNVQIQSYDGSNYSQVNPNSNNADLLDGYHAQYFLDEIASLKTSVSNGKSAIAGAITDKRISTSSSDSFQTMANNISKIGINSLNSYLNQNVFAFVSSRSRTTIINFLSSKIPTSTNKPVILMSYVNYSHTSDDSNPTYMYTYTFEIPLTDFTVGVKTQISFTASATKNTYKYNKAKE